VRFGFHFFDFTIDGQPATTAAVLRDTAQLAETAGANWFSVMDHYFQMEQYRTAHDPMLEGYTTLGFVAGVTERMRLGTIVTGVTYRHPGLLSKIVTSLDVLSGGRAFMGLGAAWYEREHLALGVPYPPLKERFERLEETLRIALQMWSDDEGPFEGEHYRLAETISVPQPISRPHPPIVIGGAGEKKTLRLVAQYADGCNITAADPETVEHKLAVLRQHCDDLGRDYDAIEKTLMGRLAGAADDPDRFLRDAERYASLGIEHIHLGVPGPDPRGESQRFVDAVVPQLLQIPVRDR
jgi:F420-dependent oxidoreductase-like protein